MQQTEDIILIRFTSNYFSVFPIRKCEIEIYVEVNLSNFEQNCLRLNYCCHYYQRKKLVWWMHSKKQSVIRTNKTKQNLTMYD